MVYRGKPSAACAECRKRRSRCDQNVPACGQCTKTGRICPGYRNPVDLMFHDESTRVVNKNKRHVSFTMASTNVHKSRASFTRRTMVQAATAPPVKLTDFVLYQPLDHLGVKFFMLNYVGDDPAVSQLFFLPDYYAKKGCATPGLQQGIIAAGLAGYAETARRREITDQATKSYHAAIRDINTAVADPKRVAQDSTLMSVIMAAIFEFLIMPRLSGLENCNKHLIGALAIASLIVKQGHQTATTRQLITAIIQAEIRTSWTLHIPLPPGFYELKGLISKKIEPQSVHASFLDILVKLVEFRHALRDGLYDSPIAIIKKALAIDDTLSDFARNMPRHARFDSYRISNEAAKQLAYEGYYHVYPELSTAHLWNNARSFRLRLHQIILRQSGVVTPSLQSDDYAFAKAQQAKSEAQINAVAAEVVATVPQLAGYLAQLESYFMRINEGPSEHNKIPSSVPSSEEPHLAIHSGPATVEWKTRFEYEQGLFNYVRYLTPPTTPLPSPLPSSSENERPVDAWTQGLPAVSSSQPASLYHMLFQLYALRSISCLHASMKQWIRGRIEWMEDVANSQDLARLQDKLRRGPGDGFPVGEDEGYVMQSYDFCTGITLRPAPWVN